MNSPGKVRRITIDERLADGLIRILIADLKAGLKTFGDDPEYWGKETELLVRPEDYQEKMGIPPEAAGKWSWDSLYEGQVFLSREFQKSSTRGVKAMFDADYLGTIGKTAVDKEQEKGFQDIDLLSKERVKKKYMAALERRS